MFIMNAKPTLSIFVLCLITQIAVFGQINFDLNLESRGGYEYNVFNANPKRTFVQDDDTLNSVQSGFYQRTSINTAIYVKSKVQDLKISGKVQHDYFPRLRIADLSRSNFKLKYGLTLHKRIIFSIHGSHTMLITNRPDDISVALTPPRGYERVVGEARLKMRLHKMSILNVQARQGLTEFKTPDSREFMYKTTGIKASLVQKIYNSKKVRHSFTLKFDYEKRLYEDIRFSAEDDVDDLSEREWIYHTLTGYYTFALKKKISISAGITIVDRQDIIQDRYGYRQMLPFAKFSVDGKRLKLSLKASAGNRVYHTYQASSLNDEVLVNGYLRSSGTLSVQLTKHLSVVGMCSYLHRTRNFAESARSFLPYDNVNGNLGIRLKLF